MRIRFIRLIGLISLSLLIFFYLFQIFHSCENSSQIKEFRILPGMSLDEIVNKLAQEEMVCSKTVFKFYNLLTGQAKKLKAGNYLLKSGQSIFKLTKILVEGPTAVSVIISPGMTLKEIDEKLSSLKIIKNGDLINFEPVLVKTDYGWLNEVYNLEGFLFPDTHYLLPGSDPQIVIRRFLDNFEAKALPFFEKKNKLLEIITLASLLEKEIPDQEEQRIAAGILLKRLAINMPLQVDATLVYIKCQGKFLNCPRLSESDYKVDSPYNTYLYNNLPPTPICNPGLGAIESVINFKKTDYWYYLSDPESKKTIFSITLDEHNQNRVKYLLNR